MRILTPALKPPVRKKRERWGAQVVAFNARQSLGRCPHLQQMKGSICELNSTSANSLPSPISLQRYAAVALINAS